jgi:hypothetical protein
MMVWFQHGPDGWYLSRFIGEITNEHFSWPKQRKKWPLNSNAKAATAGDRSPASLNKT